MTRASAHPGPDHSVVTLLTIKLLLPGCASLKEKRSLLKPLIAHLRREFNISVAETGLQDYWQSSWISCVFVSNDGQLNSRMTNEIIEYIRSRFPNLEIDEQHIENC